MPLLPGQRFDDYEVIALLGVGGMGEVYRARDSRLGREVALKTLPEAFATDPERVARFEREARILATLNHPNIATLYGIERQGAVLGLVMELVEGDSLHGLLVGNGAPNRGLPVAEVISITRQIVDALDAAHEKGIVHRDLKPANVKITPGGIVKVLDFGLAKAITGADSGSEETETAMLSPANTRPNVVMGTAAYMSPEQARGLPVDRRTDIWAFGCVLYELLAGRPAFARNTASDTIAAVLTGEIDWTLLPHATPAPLRQLLGRCLERTTRARLRDIADARPYLDETVAPTSTTMTGAAVLTTGARSQGRLSRRTLLTAAASGLLGAGLGAGVSRPFWSAGRTAAQVSFQRLTFRRGMIRSARFAPDFQTVLYGALWDGDVCRVYTVRPDSPESSAIALPPAAPLSVSASGELALSLGAHTRGIMTYGTLARVPLVGGAPRAMEEQVKFADWTTGGELALVRGKGDRDVLEFPAGHVIAEPPAPAGFSFVRVSPSGEFVAAFALDVNFNLGGRVVVYDRAGAKRTESAPYFNVFGLAWHGDEVWFTAADELPLMRNAVHAMDAAGAVRLVARVPGNTTLHDVAPDGRALIARTDDRGGVSVRVPGTNADRDLAWLDSPTMAGISADGRKALFWEGGVGGGPKFSIYLRDTDGASAVRLGDGMAMSLSPDGRWVLAKTAPEYLDLIPTGAGSPRRLERPGMVLMSGKWLADGRIVARAQSAPGRFRLHLLDVDGTAVSPITPESLSVSYVGWFVAPDGRQVAVNTPKGPEIYAIDGGAGRPLPGVTMPATVVGWIESGVLISEAPAAGGRVDRVDPTTGQRDLWADIQPPDPVGLMSANLAGLVTTPDGRGYGYSWHRATSDLFLVSGWH